jgi:hypothetical protein
MHDHGQIHSGIEGASPGRFAALVTKHEVVTLGKLGEERAQALGRAPVAATSGFQIAVVHDCAERVELRHPRAAENGQGTFAPRHGATFERRLRLRNGQSSPSRACPMRS